MPKYYEIEVSLLGIEPKIFRTFVLPASSTFRDLHDAIQDADGWEDDHMHVFWDEKGREFAGGSPIEGYDTGSSVKEDSRVKLYSYFADGKGAKNCTYIYDFGDNWEHEVRLKRVFESDEQFDRKLLDGARAFPPEDCGGVWGYEECRGLVTGKIKKSEDAEDRLEWIGDWNPEAFDLRKLQKQFNR